MYQILRKQLGDTPSVAVEHIMMACLPSTTQITTISTQVHPSTILYTRTDIPFLHVKNTRGRLEQQPDELVYRYLHVQAQPVMNGLARAMLTGGSFCLSPG